MSDVELSIPWHVWTEKDIEEVSARLRDLPSAIQALEAQDGHVREGVAQLYAAWKMQNDCNQHPGELALLIRKAIAYELFMYSMYTNAIDPKDTQGIILTLQ